MDPKTNIIVQLRDIWLKLKEEKKEISDKLEDELPDSQKEDLRQAADGASKVYDAHLNNIAMNVKNNFYTWKDVESVDKELAIEIESFLQNKEDD